MIASSELTTHTFTWQDGNTPLSVAIRESHFRTMKYLVEGGADVEAKDTVSDVHVVEI